MSHELPKNVEVVNISQHFGGTIKKTGATNTLVLHGKEYYQNELNKFKDGERVTVSITNKKAKRTSQQNKYYWGAYLPLIAKETGESDIERLHELFKGKFLTTGIVEVLGAKVRMKKSTTDLSIADFCEYIMAIESLTGVSAPPTESFELEPLRTSVDNHSRQDKPQPANMTSL